VRPPTGGYVTVTADIAGTGRHRGSTGPAEHFLRTTYLPMDDNEMGHRPISYQDEFSA